MGQINTTDKARKYKVHRKNEESTFSSNGDEEEEEKSKTKRTPAVREREITRVTSHMQTSILTSFPDARDEKGKD